MYIVYKHSNQCLFEPKQSDLQTEPMLGYLVLEVSCFNQRLVRLKAKMTRTFSSARGLNCSVGL